jgi:hypothetical protein
MIVAEMLRQFLQLHVGDVGKVSCCMAGVD